MGRTVRSLPADLDVRSAMREHLESKRSRYTDRTDDTAQAMRLFYQRDLDRLSAGCPFRCRRWQLPRDVRHVLPVTPANSWFELAQDGSLTRVSGPLR